MITSETLARNMGIFGEKGASFLSEFPCPYLLFLRKRLTSRYRKHGTTFKNNFHKEPTSINVPHPGTQAWKASGPWATSSPQLCN